MHSFLKNNLNLIFFISLLFLPFIALGNFFLLLLFFSLIILKEKLPEIDFQTSFLILYVIFTFFSIIFSMDFYRSLGEGKEILNFIAYFLSLIYFSKKIKNEKLIFAFIIPSLFLSFYGILEYFIKGIGDKNYRIHGLQSHYMTYSGFLLIYFAVLISYFILGENKKFRRISFFGALLAIPPIFLSLTRNTWIGLFAILFFLLFFFNKKYLILFFLIPLLLFIFLPDTVGKRIFSIFDLKDKTNFDRLMMWKASFNIFLQKPITGFGLGIPQKDYIFFKEEGGIRERIPHFHSNIFQILPERGIFALISYFGFITTALFSAYKKRKTWQGLASFLSLLAISLGGLFEFYFGDTEILWMTLFLSNLHREVDE